MSCGLLRVAFPLIQYVRTTHNSQLKPLQCLPKRPASSYLVQGNRKKGPASAAKEKVPSAHGPRWSKVSGSANAEEGFKEVIKDRQKAYSYRCYCKQNFFQTGNVDDEEGEDKVSEADKKPQTKSGILTCKTGEEHTLRRWHNLHMQQVCSGTPRTPLGRYAGWNPQDQLHEDPRHSASP